MKNKLMLITTTLVCIWLITIISCGATPSPEPPKTVELKDLKQIPPAELFDKIYDVSLKRFVSFDEMIVNAGKSGVIYVGETHDNVIHHQVQEKVLKAVYAKNGRTKKMAIGMEMFQRPYQPFLNDYIARKIDEKEMLRKTEYYNRWSFEWSMYQPMVSFAYANGLKIVALNAPAEISKKVSRGGLAALAEEERKLLPEKIDTTNKIHREYIYDRFKPHIKMGMFSEDNFDKFYDAQCVWEDTMADSAAGYFRWLGKDAASGQIIIFVGGGHTMYRFGIPERVKWRTQMDYCSILCIELVDRKVGAKSEDEGIMELLDAYNSPADYLYFARRIKIDEIRPMLGVMLGQPLPDKKGLPIKDVVPNSAAAKAGLKPDDIVIFIDNQTIADMLDLKFAMFNKKENDKIEVGILRGKETKAVIITLELKKKEPE